MATATSSPPAPMASAPSPPAVGGWLGEASGDALQVAVVVGVAKVGLEHVVVHVADRQLGAHPRQAHGLELEPGHRAGGVLGEGLVEVDGDIFAGHPLAGD